MDLKEPRTKEQEQSGWERMWNANKTPWDSGNIDVSLKQLIEEKGFELAQEGSGLVPGCGRGYDVVYLAQKGYKTFGLDISKTAVEKAAEYATFQAKTQVQPDLLDKIGWIVGDYYSFTIPDSKFQFVFDFNFFCTVYPEDRPAWAKRSAEIISPGGHLVTLMYPMSDITKKPPPFTLSESIYHETLDPFFDLVYINQDPKKDPRRPAKKAMAVWKRK